MAGYSTSGVSFVQSPVAETSKSGRGAIIAPISILLKSIRKLGAFSHKQPPCICAEIILTGADTLILSSIAISMKACVPPPEAPVHAIRSGSTSGKDCKKSMDRIAFCNCKPNRLIPQIASRSPLGKER